MATQPARTGETVLQRLKMSNWTVVAPFLLLFLVQLVHHQMWRDELNALGIAAASPNLSTLFHYIHYEGHPGLWYLLLWFVTRWSTSPAILQAVQAVVGLSICCIIGLQSPFSKLERILLLLGYYVSFEYTVLSRTYGVCFLLLLLYARNRVKFPERLCVNALLLGLLANTDIVGLILAAAFALEYAFNHYQNRPESNSRRWLAIVIYTALVTFSIWSAKPAADISWRTTGHPFDHVTDLNHLASAAINQLVLCWFPIGSGFPAHFWNPSAAPSLLGLVLALSSAYLLGRVFLQDRDLLLVVAFTTAVSIAFSHLVYMASARNLGILFIAMLAALWIQRPRRPTLSRARYVFWILSAVAGVMAGYAQWTHPFSNAGYAARWLRSQHFETTVIGTPDTSIAGLAEELQRPAYYLDCDCSGTFLLFSNRRDSFHENEIPQRLARAFERLNKPELLFALVRPITGPETAALKSYSIQISPLAKFDGAEDWQEDFYLYRSTRSRTNSLPQKCK